LAELEAHLDPESGIDKTWRRNASLAWVKFCFEAATPFSVIPGADGKGQVLNHIPIVFKYLLKFGDANTAYKDLRPYVERLDIEERSQLLELLFKSDVFGAEVARERVLEEITNIGPRDEDVSRPVDVTLLGHFGVTATRFHGADLFLAFNSQQYCPIHQCLQVTISSC